ncbi:uncharacterized protein EV154DRAFT_478509 [Mucor mucedo]|uniref:uncharacterized protein n=1 Tax=Mucor mucedo TaxID=29922 RepID=UPI00221F40B0|nr:uncharacterized protein EV154DRAFT_478509 [Mucor mucedo]KAI7894261.1 hypothetical protein EV154DRAFT_478509 [Mucor mucedo]
MLIKVAFLYICTVIDDEELAKAFSKDGTLDDMIYNVLNKFTKDGEDEDMVEKALSTIHTIPDQILPLPVSNMYFAFRVCLLHVDFDYENIVSDITPINKEGSKKIKGSGEVTHRASLLYDTDTETVIARGDLVENSEELQEGVIFVSNIFSELKSSYSGFNPKSDTHAVRYKNFLQEAINMLQEIQHHWKQEEEGSDMDFYYAIIMPTNWEYVTREELFRPLLIKAGLIHGNDGQGRLIFFSKLESTFQSMQENPDILRGVDIKHGDQYVICTLDYRGEFFVTLDLVSAQYPVFSVAGGKWVPQLLRQVIFTIPFGLKEWRVSLIACLKTRCGNTVSLEIIDILLEEFNVYFDHVKLADPNSMPRLIFPDHPFQKVKALYDNRYGLKAEEIHTIQLITLDHIYESFLGGPVEKEFQIQMKMFYNTSILKVKYMCIFVTDHITTRGILGWPLLFIRNWCWTFSKEQKNFFKLIAVYNKKSLSLPLDTLLRPSQASGIKSLIANQMQVFNMRRDPIILSKDTTIEHLESCSNPIIFINIDMSPTQTRTDVTCLDENRQAKQTKTFDCDMKPLDSFITYSEVYQRPMLHIDQRLKLYLEKIFGDYIKLFSTSNTQSMTRRILLKLASKLLDLISDEMQKRLKSSKNPLKEIRNLFIHSNPNLFQNLVENFKMDDLFTSNDEFCAVDNDLFTTYHPGYIFFFTITYLYNFNKTLEEKLENMVGSNWQSNNIWYGVSIDKNLLDTVFGSIKKLEKSFFACGILQKDDNRRRAKFCTRGEEILPAIQRMLVDLEFKIKSYFVVAQVFSKHIQLTLHQVVILASSEKDAASIIVQDEILYIDDVYDNLCKILWSCMQTHCQVNSCATHKNMHSVQYDLCDFQAYSDVTQNLRRSVVELLEMNKTSMDMNSKIQLNINSKCACSISIFLRDIIEVALMSVIENVATIIAASLTNKRLFGNYVANYIFVSGDPFNLSYGSKTHTTYTMLLQKSIDNAVQFKEKDTISFALGVSLYQLLQLVKHTKPYMFEHFIFGRLCQVSSETYALRIKQRYLERYLPFIAISRDDDIKNTMRGDSSYVVFIQKGKPVSTKSFIIQYQLMVSSPRLDIIQLDSSKNAVPKKYSVIDGNATGTTYVMYTNLVNTGSSNMVVECKQIKYNLSLKVSSVCKGLYYMNYDFPYRFLNIIEPLTLVYM